MDWLPQHPFLLWIAVGAVLLAIEVGTGSGWLLWPAGSAVVTALLALAMPLDPSLQAVVFAVLTIITTLAGRHFFPRRPLAADINDTATRLAGLEGVAATEFQAGRGRVFVDGKEWAAELQGAASLATGVKIVVVGVHGARLTVKQA
jgi:membrane protein implicated in regulation of membrane protease activity